MSCVKLCLRCAGLAKMDVLERLPNLATSKKFVPEKQPAAISKHPKPQNPATMNPQAFRSVCTRARPEVQKTGYALKNYFRDFSTGQSLGADEASTPPSKPSIRQRTRAAATEINSLVKRGNSSAGQRSGPAAGAGTGQPKVLDVRSLPKGLSRGRGGFRGRGGQVGAVPQGQPPRAQSPTGNRFSRPTGGRGSAVRGGRGGRGGGGRGAARGGAKGRRSDKDADKDKDKKFGKRQDPFEVMDPYEEQFDKDMRFGVTTQYKPSLTLDSLSLFAPATPTNAAGRKATVLENLSALGTADPVGVPQDLQARSYAQDLETDGLRFFADAKAREAAEQYLQENKEIKEGEEKVEGAIITDAEESVKQVIFDRAVAGTHEKMAFATGPVGVSRNWHLRAETYTGKDVDRFEKKLSALVGAKGAAPAAGQGKKKKAEAK